MTDFKYVNPNTYFKDYYENLRVKFDTAQDLVQNYSQSLQDIFTLSVLNGKRNGTYLEIGGADGIDINNTFLLESEYDWKGIAFEWLEPGWNSYISKRKNPCFCEDATKADYAKLLADHNFPSQIDFLQVDIEPAQQTLDALKAIPHDKYRFSVICFETAIYCGQDLHVQQEQIDLLESLGYVMIAKNVSNVGNDPFEDWWVDPTAVDMDRVVPYIEGGFTDDREKRCLEVIYKS
jgi:hypothetical protein